MTFQEGNVLRESCVLSYGYVRQDIMTSLWRAQRSKRQAVFMSYSVRMS